MSIPVLIIGEPGSGKSYSLRNFSREESAIIQTVPKPLPFRNALSVASTTDLSKARKAALGIKDKAVIVFDDFGYFITDLWTKGGKGYELYKDIGTEIYNFVMDIMTDGQARRIAYFIMHEQQGENGVIEPLTLGKLLNEKIKLMGLFTVALHAVASDDGEYKFITNGQPFKSPPDMFEREIPNDLKAVDTAIREYYNLKPFEPIKAEPSTAPKAEEKNEAENDAA